jgi:hypothetical protein
MCHEHHGHGEERGPGFRGARGFRGFGRRGFPSREEWVERLEFQRDRLEQDLANVRELIARLKDDPAPEPSSF